jgi:hypothetical protein
MNQMERRRYLMAAAVLATSMAAPAAALGAAVPPPTPTPSPQNLAVDVPNLGQNEFTWTVPAGATIRLAAAGMVGARLRYGGDLVPVSVRDGRPGALPWSVSGQVSSFTGPATLPGAWLGWAPAVSARGAGANPGVLVPPGPPGTGLSVSRVLAVAVSGHGSDPRRAATLGARLALALPSDVKGGSYRAVLTLTALT